MKSMPSTATNRPRDRSRERRERLRYQILRAVYEHAGARCDTPVSGLAVGESLGLSREETFRTVYDLTHRGLLFYRGAGPRVCLTEKGIAYLERGAGRRHSIRDD